MVYFDANATTPLFAQAKQAWQDASAQAWANPSSLHRAGSKVHAKLEIARETFAELLQCSKGNIIFNSGATEGVNTLFAFFARAYPNKKILISAIEHPCVYEAAKKHFASKVLLAPVDGNGLVDLNFIKKAFVQEELNLVSVMAANNETGVCQPWEEIALLCKEGGVAFHCDAVQWMGKLPLEGFSRVDFLSVSAHKLGGPKGIGFLKISGNRGPMGLQVGGLQEGGHRAGTENYPAVASFLRAFQYVYENQLKVASGWQAGRKAFESRLLETIPDIKIHAFDSTRLPNTSSITFPKFENHCFVHGLDALGFEISTGSACSTGKEGPSVVLKAMGLSDQLARQTVRVSAGFEITMEDWISLADGVIEVWNSLNTKSEGLSSVISIE